MKAMSSADNFPSQLVYGCLPKASNSLTDMFLEAIGSVSTTLTFLAKSKVWIEASSFPSICMVPDILG